MVKISELKEELKECGSNEGLTVLFKEKGKGGRIGGRRESENLIAWGKGALNWSSIREVGMKRETVRKSLIFSLWCLTEITLDCPSSSPRG